MKRRLILILLLNGFGATYAQDASDEEQIKETLTAMWAAIEVGDVDRYATYVHLDSSAFGENDVYLSESKDTDSGIQGGQRFSSRGKSTRIFVKEEGRWLCIHSAMRNRKAQRPGADKRAGRA